MAEDVVLIVAMGIDGKGGTHIVELFDGATEVPLRPTFPDSFRFSAEPLPSTTLADLIRPASQSA